MGCDIHMLMEVKPANSDQWRLHGTIDKEDDGEGGTYITPAERYSGRNYNLFAALADVRNGSGFAGCDTGDRIEPISLPRGVPDDASPEYKQWVEQWGVDGHSHSYHTLAQLLDYDWVATKVTRGWLDMPTYAKWAGYWEKQGDAPDGWCGSVGGGNTRHLSSREEADAIIAQAPTDYHAKQEWLKEHHRSTYVQCEWRQPSARTIGGEFWYGVLAPLLKLAKQYGGYENVRIVFFFDN